MSKKTSKASKSVKTISSKKPSAGKKRIMTKAEYEAQVEAPVETPAASQPEPTPVTMTKDEAVNAAMEAVAAEKQKRSSGLDAAAHVLREAGEPLTCGEMVKRMLDRGLWTTDGKTPAATIYSAVIREIAVNGDQSRFRKTTRGKFEVVK